MTTPYILPQMLKDAPLGLDWTSIQTTQTTPLDNLSALMDVCDVASGDIDRTCFQPIRATSQVEGLEGPDYRLTIRNSTGVAQCIMSHWPVIAALGGQVAQAASFPRTWKAIPENMMAVPEGLYDVLGGSQVGVSGGDGSNQIEIAPGYVSWLTGRDSAVLQIAYQSGWPHAGIMPSGTTTVVTTIDSDVVTVGSVAGMSAGLPVADLKGAIPFGTTIVSISGHTVTLSKEAVQSQTVDALYLGYPAGTTKFNVDDVTAFASTMPHIFDGLWRERVTVASIAATAPIVLLPTITVTGGPGTVTLSAPTRFPHTGGQPARALLSTVPDVVRLSGYYFAAAEAMVRGATAMTAQALPGSAVKTAGPTMSPNGLTMIAEKKLANFMRNI